jgi:HAD superfamily hydrolase (TIGR01484 family)
MPSKSSVLCAPWSRASSAELKKVRGICLDIDDTLSTDGKLTAEAYEALWSLKRSGFIVVPITGRPAGWCDQIARFWPVDAVVGENGAFTFFIQDGVRRRIDTPSQRGRLTRPGNIAELGQKIKKKFPHARWASDQKYREYDLAIDICEDVPAWSKRDVQALLDLCHSEGAHAKLSSIHVNAWFGNYDKRSGFEYWLTSGAPGFVGKKLPAMNEWLFIGDSPNDEPMFAAFQYSVGVANLKRYLSGLKNPPRWITKAESGAGFVEMAKRLVKRSR